MRLILAYIDPGTGGLLLQFILGGAVGVAAFVRYRWKTIKEKFGAADNAPQPDRSTDGSREIIERE